VYAIGMTEREVAALPKIRIEEGIEKVPFLAGLDGTPTTDQRTMLDHIHAVCRMKFPDAQLIHRGGSHVAVHFRKSKRDILISIY
jgi:hypothetical protein